MYYSAEFSPSGAGSSDPEVIAASTFEPFPELNGTDFDTTLVFLASNASFLSEVRDPWFRSTQLSPTSQFSYNNTETIVDLYDADNVVTVVACAEQHQLRNPLTGVTGPLGGVEVMTRTQAQRLNLTDKQLAVFDRSLGLATYSLISEMVPVLGGNLLLATSGQCYGSIPGLPDNQWQTEFEHYFGVALNVLQTWSLQYVTGPVLPHKQHYIVPASDDFEKEMCVNQVIRKSDHRSFSVLGLVIILVFGVLFILANLTVSAIVDSVQKRTQKGRYRNAEWHANEVLQLQRMAYEHSKTGTWKGHNEMVPRTNPGEMFTIPESAQANPTALGEAVTTTEGRRRRWFRRRSTSTKDLQIMRPNTLESTQEEKDTKDETQVEKVVAISEKEVQQE